MSGSGVKLFVSGEIAKAIDINEYLMDQVIARFPTEAARDAAFGDGIPVSLGGSGKPQLTEGRFCYIDDAPPGAEVQFYNGSIWVSSSQFAIGDGAVDTLQIADDAVTSAKIAPNSVDSSHIAPGTIIASDIEDDAVTTDKILNGAVTSDKLDDSPGLEAVTTSVIRDGAITSEKLDSDLELDGSITVNGTTFIAEIIEKVHFDGAVSGLEAIDILSAGIHFFEDSSSASCSLNFIGDETNTFDSLTEVGQSVTGVILITSGSTLARPTSISIDGELVTDVKWFGGVSFPPGSGGDAIDSYTITIIKTDDTPTYTVLASQSKFS